MEKLEEILEWGGIKKDITCLIISAIALGMNIFNLVELPFDAAWISIILCGVPIIVEAIIGLVTAFDIKADVLVSIALIASIFIGENFAAGEVAFIMQLGALLEDLTVAKAHAGIEKLINLTPRTARIVEDNEEKIISAEQVNKGNIIRVLPGETIPADGIIIKGQTSIDQSVMTGESMPVDKAEGDEVKSGTVNQFGAFEMKATMAGENSSLQRMIRLVQSADAGKAKIVGIADRWATWIVVIALSAAGLTWAITGQIIRAVTILVVFCPCALVLATPTAIMVAIGNVTKHGILVREGDALERLSQIKKITFDKTGTLTYGKPRVIHVKSSLPQYSDDRLFEIIAEAEVMSEHPLGKAVAASYYENTGKKAGKPAEFKIIPGRGVSAQVDGNEVIAGNINFMNENNIKEFNDKDTRAYVEKGCTVIYIAVSGVYAGFIALADIMRDDTRKVIDKIKNIGVSAVLLTGDNKSAASQIAAQSGIDDFKAECMPEDKLTVIDKFEKQNMHVCMVGDGINDAPALRKATVGIAMGGIGSDIAVDAADIVLVRDDISSIPHLLALSKRMINTIKLNMTFSMALNFVAIILAITGVLNPVVGALVHNAGSIIVIINSAFLLKWRSKEYDI